MSSSESENEEYLTEGESSSNQAAENDSSASDVEKRKENHRSQQLQCGDIARKVRSCPDEWSAVNACSAIFLYADLTKCVEADKLWFGICLDAHCNKDKDKCKQLKTKVAECGFRFPRRTPRVMIGFMALLDTC